MSVAQWFTVPAPSLNSAPSLNPAPLPLPAASPPPPVTRAASPPPTPPATPPLTRALGGKDKSAYSDECPDPGEDPHINTHPTIHGRTGFISHFENTPTGKVYYFFYDGCDEATQIPAAWFLENPVTKRSRRGEGKN